MFDGIAEHVGRKQSCRLRIVFFFFFFFTKLLIFYLSIYLPIRLNPRGGHQTGSGEPSAGGYAFGMARPGFEPATSRSRSGRSTT